MHYLHNPAQNNTVMLALMNGGVISSFEIDSNYQSQIPTAPINKTAANATQTNETASSTEIETLEKSKKAKAQKK